MTHISFGGLLVVAVIAFGAPLLVNLSPKARIPADMVAIVAGIIVGPSVLDWVRIDTPVTVLSLLGLAFLLFLAGLELDLDRLRGPLLRLAGSGFLISVAIGVIAGWTFHAVGYVRSPFLLAVVLSATSLGLVVIIALALSKLNRSMRLDAVLTRLQDTTAEIRVRIAIVLLVGFVAVAEKIGLEAILGAFLAGGILAAADKRSMSHPHFRAKLEAIGYGFLVPVFFVASGVRFDLQALTQSPSAFARVPLFLIALPARGLPAALYHRRVGDRGAVAAGLLQATSLPFLVTAVQIGQSAGKIRAATGAALIFAGLLSVVIFPVSALRLLGTQPSPTPGVEVVDRAVQGRPV